MLRHHEIKREKKKSLFMREVSMLIHSLGGEDPVVAQAYVTRVDFSADSGICYVYFSTYGELSEQAFEKILDRLKLYKPSLRKAIAQRIPARYTPDFVFIYDKIKEKEYKINQILDKVAEELKTQQKDEEKSDE